MLGGEDGTAEAVDTVEDGLGMGGGENRFGQRGAGGDAGGGGDLRHLGFWPGGRRASFRPGGEADSRLGRGRCRCKTRAQLADASTSSGGSVTFDQLIGASRLGLAVTLHDLFLIAALVAGVALIAPVVPREVPSS